MKIDMNKIKELIYNREYDKVKTILQKKTDNKVNITILKLIKNLENINEVRYLVDEFSYDLKNPFKSYFEALRYKDYESAYDFSKECMAIGDNNNIDFVIYNYILEDIIAAIKTENRLYEIDAELDIYRHKKSITSKKDIIVMETLLNEKLNLRYDEHSQNMLQLIEMVKQIDINNLNIDYFENFDQEGNNITLDFLTMIKQGDYLTAFNIISQDKNLKDICYGSIGVKNALLYKKLLFYFKSKMVTKRTFTQSNNDIEEVKNEQLDNLENLREIIKKKDYMHASLYYQKYMNTNTNQEIKILLDFLQQCQLKECYHNYHQYKYYLKRGDIENANKFFKLYKKAISGTILDRNIDYIKNRIKIMKKEINTSNFVKKEQIYDTAEYYYENNMYFACIQVLKEYIDLDKDISQKAYLLRGRAYEKLKKYEQAISDYHKVIEIAPSPGAYLRLSVIYKNKNNYEEVLKNSLAYEEIKPCYNSLNVARIIQMYQLLGDTENIKIYEEMLDYLQGSNQKLLQYKKI